MRPLIFSFSFFAASRLLLLMLLRLVVRPDNVCTSYDVFSGAALNYYRNNWCLSLRAFFPHSPSKSGTFPGTALTGDRSPKTGTVPGNRGRLVTLSTTEHCSLADCLLMYTKLMQS